MIGYSGVEKTPSGAPPSPLPTASAITGFYVKSGDRPVLDMEGERPTE
ncbi:MAG TPA: hypothetical protein VEH77_16055 [Roseiarcus sp.]|nr:hypothetical protein [Roseiarcus sp.]